MSEMSSSMDGDAVSLLASEEIYDFDKICRLCLLEKSSLMRIFAKKTKSNLIPLPIRIMSCASLEVYQGDGLPSKICPKCLWSVNQAYTFREQCESANTRLQKYLHRLKLSNPPSNQTQYNLENETQEAIPLEYLDAQITISEPASGSVLIKKEEGVDIKAEPEGDVESMGCNRDIELVDEDDEEQNGSIEGQEPDNPPADVDEGDDDEDEEEEEEDDKPISELINFSRTNTDNCRATLQGGCHSPPECIQSLKEEGNEIEPEPMEHKTDMAISDSPRPSREILQTPKLTRRFLAPTEYTKDPTYNSHKKFYVTGSEYVKVKKKCPKTLQEKPVKLKLKPSLISNGEWESLIELKDKPRKKYAPRERNLISNNSSAIIEQDGSKSKFRACTHCGKVVLGKNMGIHVKIHVGNKSHLCDICGKSFLYKKTLETHKRVHSGERPCVCKVCGKTFRSSSRLSDHMSTHTGRKPFICEICAVAFRIKGHLKKHLRVHSGEKPYICCFCEKAFSDAWNMKCHLRIHTGEKPPHSCPVCGQCFLRRNKMEEHCKVTHGEEYVLPRKQTIVQRLMNDLVDQNEELRAITEREREEMMRKESERQFLQSHLDAQRQELAERFSQVADGQVPLPVAMPIPVPVPAFPGNIPGIFSL